MNCPPVDQKEKLNESTGKEEKKVEKIEDAKLTGFMSKRLKTTNLTTRANYGIQPPFKNDTLRIQTHDLTTRAHKNKYYLNHSIISSPDNYGE